MILKPFNYKNVTLLDSRFKRQFEECCEYFLNIPTDDMLVGFRKRCGTFNRGNELGGWYSNDGSFDVYSYDEIFNTFPQWLSAFSKMYAATGDIRFKDKALEMFFEWAKCVMDDGYFFYSNFPNAYHYEYEKYVSGMLDLYEFCDIKEALSYLEKITCWAENNLHLARLPACTPGAFFTGGDMSVGRTDNEWYTLSESLYRAFLITDNERYREFARLWLYDYYFDAIRAGDKEKITGVHGYSHVNTLSSAAMAYIAEGQEKYLDTIINGYEYIKDNEMFASGGYAPDEKMAGAGDNFASLEYIAKTFEAPCGSWAGFKLVRYLISLTGSAKYGEWAETLLCNAIGACLPMKDDALRRGKTPYYADYRASGGRKNYYEHSFPCCSGTYPQATCEYHNLIYYQGNDKIYITQYIPSILITDGIKITLSGEFEKKGTVKVKVEGGNCTLCLRVPSWAENGGSWLELKLQDKEQKEVCFKPYLRFVPIDKNHPDRAALMYGAVMLAAEGKSDGKIKGDVNNPDSFIKQTGELVFETDEGIKFKPYYEFKQKEWHRVYIDIIKS